jgi:hypothetical protein
MDKKKVIGHFVATLGGLVLSGALATYLGEQLGYSVLALYLYALLGHSKVAGFISSKVK